MKTTDFILLFLGAVIGIFIGWYSFLHAYENKVGRTYYLQKERDVYLECKRVHYHLAWEDGEGYIKVYTFSDTNGAHYVAVNNKTGFVSIK